MSASEHAAHGDRAGGARRRLVRRAPSDRRHRLDRVAVRLPRPVGRHRHALREQLLPAGNRQPARDRPAQARLPGPGGRRRPDRVQASRGVRSPDAAARARIAPVLAQIARLPHVTAVVSPYSAAGARQISRTGGVAFATVTFDENAGALPKPAVQRVIDIAQGAVLAAAAGRARRPGDRAGPAAVDRGGHRRRPARGDHRAAHHLRLGDRHGAADHHRSARPGHRHRTRRARLPAPQHAGLRDRARGDDRTRRGHRLRALHRHPLPRELRARTRRRRRPPPRRWTPPVGRCCSPASRSSSPCSASSRSAWGSSTAWPSRRRSRC